MGHAWKDPIQLSKFWTIFWHSLEVAGPVALPIVALFPGVFPSTTIWTVTLIAIAGITLVSYGVLKYVQHRGDPRRYYFECLLDELWESIWQDVESFQGARHHHRITYFELTKIGWLRRLCCGRKWTHKLVPRLRVPKGGQRPRRAWRVHHHITDNCEGIAGRVFAEGKMGKVLISDTLPDLHSETVEKARDRLVPNGRLRRVTHGVIRAARRCGINVVKQKYARDVLRYAQRTNDDPWAVERERYFARVIGGVAILHGGKRYGVLILDAPDPNAVTAELLQSEAVRRTLRLLSQVVAGKERSS